MALRAFLLTAVGAVCVALIQPLFLTDPLRAGLEGVWYAAYASNWLLNCQGSGNWLDQRFAHLSDYMSAHMPSSAAGEAEWAGRLHFMDAKDYTPQAFVNVSGGFRNLVVVRGLFSNTPAVRHWSPAFLSRRFGDLPVSAVVDGAGCQDQHEAELRRRRVTSDGCQESMTLADMLARMPHRPTYVKQLSSVFANNSDLVDDLELGKLGKEVFDPMADRINTMFVGHGADYPVWSGLHAAIVPNYFIMVQGEKTWTVAPATYTPYMQPFVAHYTSAVFSRLMTVAGRSSLRASHGWASIPTRQITLHPGDFLYVPSFWWHEVTHPPHTGFHLGVGLRPKGVGTLLRQYVPGVGENWVEAMMLLPGVVQKLAQMAVTGKEWYELHREAQQTAHQP